MCNSSSYSMIFLQCHTFISLSFSLNLHWSSLLPPVFSCHFYFVHVGLTAPFVFLPFSLVFCASCLSPTTVAAFFSSTGCFIIRPNFCSVLFICGFFFFPSWSQPFCQSYFFFHIGFSVVSLIPFSLIWASFCSFLLFIFLYFPFLSWPSQLTPSLYHSGLLNAVPWLILSALWAPLLVPLAWTCVFVTLYVDVLGLMCNCGERRDAACCGNPPSLLPSPHSPFYCSSCLPLLGCSPQFPSGQEQLRSRDPI